MADINVTLGPLFRLGALLMPPSIQFGSPVQRAKAENEVFWHIPVRVEPGRLWSKASPRWLGPATIVGAEVHLEKFDGETPSGGVLCWGDAWQQQPQPLISLRRYHVALVPVAYRSELGEGGRAYWTDNRFHNGKREMPINPDKRKHFFRIRVKSGSYSRVSDFYQLRVPLLAGNGHFAVERVYSPMDPKEADREGRLRAVIPVPPTLDEALSRDIVVMSAQVEANPYDGDRNRWRIRFSFYNGTGNDIRLWRASGHLGAGREYVHGARLVKDKVILRGHVGTISIDQTSEDLSQDPRAGRHVALYLRELAIIGQLAGNANVTFRVGLPDQLQFDRENRWHVNDDTFVRFHKDRLDSWDDNDK